MKILLGAAKRQPEACDHLIKDQKRSVLFRNLPQKFQKTGSRGHYPHIGRNRFHHHGGDFLRIGLEQFFHRSRIIVLGHQGIFGIIRGNSGAVRNRGCQSCRTGLDQKPVRMSVIAALEFDDLIPLRIPPRYPDRTHHRLRAGADQTAHLHGRDQLRKQFCHLHLLFRRRAVGQSVSARLPDLFDHSGMGMSQDSRSPGTDIVDHLISIHIHDPASMGGRYKPGCPSYGTEGAHRTVHAPRNMAFCRFKQLS